MNGLLLNKIFKDKTVYLRPSLQLLVVPANAKKDRGTLSDDDDDIEIDLTDSSPPMNSLNVTVLHVIEDAPSELIDAPYSTAGSDGPLIITEEENATVSRVLDCPRLKERLKTLGVLDAMTKYPNAFKHVMCYTEDTLTAKTFDNIFRCVLHPLGSNKRGTENLVISLWKDFIQELQGDCTTVVH
ncbi:UNVERIFIED_CONTAM: hypothetical protein FKN15_070150 [Acipenser sinensis]